MLRGGRNLPAGEEIATHGCPVEDFRSLPGLGCFWESLRGNPVDHSMSFTWRFHPYPASTGLSMAHRSTQGNYGVNAGILNMGYDTNARYFSGFGFWCCSASGHSLHSHCHRIGGHHSNGIPPGQRNGRKHMLISIVWMRFPTGFSIRTFGESDGSPFPAGSGDQFTGGDYPTGGQGSEQGRPADQQCPYIRESAVGCLPDAGLGDGPGGPLAGVLEDMVIVMILITTWMAAMPAGHIPVPIQQGPAMQGFRGNDRPRSEPGFPSSNDCATLAVHRVFHYWDPGTRLSTHTSNGGLSGDDHGDRPSRTSFRPLEGLSTGAPPAGPLQGDGRKAMDHDALCPYRWPPRAGSMDL